MISGENSMEILSSAKAAPSLRSAFSLLSVGVLVAFGECSFRFFGPLMPTSLPTVLLLHSVLPVIHPLFLQLFPALLVCFYILFR